ncbi:MAG: NAD(P)H-dependent oxidoreductase [Gemmatimonadaceae bacterium]|nr:NAD(P)H-dependent oxidoreductase [Acetobacteraceae bacterium]
MHVLTVFAHPQRKSFPGSVLDHFVEGIAQAGHTAEVADLHAEGFDPRFNAADHAHFWGEPRPEEIAREAARVEAADALAFVFPVHWWSLPAMTKGWIDRVFTAGWAYAVDAENTQRGYLVDKPVMLIGTGGIRERTYAKYGYSDAMRTQIEIGIFGFCGMTDVETHLFHDVDGDANAERRAGYLIAARALGAGLVAPDRVPKHVQRSSVLERA